MSESYGEGPVSLNPAPSPKVGFRRRVGGFDNTGMAAGMSWITGGSAIVARSNLIGVGSPTAAISAGGYDYTLTLVGQTEVYNGVSWAAETSLNTARADFAGVGTLSAAFAFAGNYGPAVTGTGETFNGTTWTAVVHSLNTARSELAGCGTPTAALAIAGTSTGTGYAGVISSVELYNGTSWTTQGGSLNTARQEFAGCGTSAAAMIYGGVNIGNVTLGSSETYNGSTWSSGPASLNTARLVHAGCGVSNSALATGGYNGSAIGSVEGFNGTTWQIVSYLLTARFHHAGCGTASGSLMFGGVNKAGTTIGSTEKEVINAPSAGFVASVTSGSGALTVSFTDKSTNFPYTWSWNFGDGNTSSSQNSSHSYVTAGIFSVKLTATNSTGAATVVATNLITVAAIAPSANFSGTPLSGHPPLAVQFTDSSLYQPTSWSWMFGDGGTSLAESPSYTYLSAGTFTVSLTAANAQGSNTDTQAGYIVVTYVPTWNTLAAVLNTPRYLLAGAGVQAAALSFGGYVSASSNVTELWNNVSWTTKNTLNTARFNLCGFGTSSAAISAGGFIATYSAVVEQWNGTSWTNKTALGTAVDGPGGCGTTGAGVVFGGAASTGDVGTTTYWNGTTWLVQGGVLNDATDAFGYCGSQTAALRIGGNYPGGSTTTNTTESWNGTAWSFGGNLSTHVYELAASGTSSAALSFGGNFGGALMTTELYNGTAWAAATSMSAALYDHAGCGISTVALAFGGKNRGGTTVGTTET